MSYNYKVDISYLQIKQKCEVEGIVFSSTEEQAKNELIKFYQQPNTIVESIQLTHNETAPILQQNCNFISL